MWNVSVHCCWVNTNYNLMWEKVLNPGLCSKLIGWLPLPAMRKHYTNTTTTTLIFLWETTKHRETIVQLRIIIVFFFLIGMFYLHHVIKFQNSANAVPTDFPVISSNHQAMVTGTGVSQKLLLLKQLFFHFRNQILELQCLCDNQTPSDLSDICP